MTTVIGTPQMHPPQCDDDDYDERYRHPARRQSADIGSRSNIYNVTSNIRTCARGQQQQDVQCALLAYGHADR